MAKGQKQEFDAESGELVSSEEEDFADEDYDMDIADDYGDLDE